MPIYEYQCASCQKRFTELSRTVKGASESVAPPCPHCQSEDTRRVVSGFAVHGPGQIDSKEISAQQAAASREASITPKGQIERWRDGTN